MLNRTLAVDRVEERRDAAQPAWMAEATLAVTIALWLHNVDVGDPVRAAAMFRASASRGFEIDYTPQGDLVDILGDVVTFFKYRTYRHGSFVSEVSGHGAPPVYYYPLVGGGVLCSTERIESPDLRTYLGEALVAGADVPECWLWPDFDWRRGLHGG